MRRALVASSIAALASLLPAVASADNVLHVGEAKLDPPTVMTLGVQLLISGDDDFNAQVTVRYKKVGDAAFRDGMPLFRVHPEVVTGLSVPAQFAGSIFDLAPGTPYDIELHAVDPDGSIDQTVTMLASTLPVPADPPKPHVVAVGDALSLKTALLGAKAGDVIEISPGTIHGQFQISASGTESNPIVVRGTSLDGVIIDGDSCTGCNVFDVYGSYVHLERMTIQHAERAVRFQTAGAAGNVLRRLHVKDVTLGIGGKSDQKNFYICDNVFEGRLAWPLNYGSDGAAHASDDGLVVTGSGMVVCHNTISGFADALQNFQEGTRGNDFYGNDILWTYDDGIEFDGTAGNSRCFRNRFTNTYDTLSYQPVFGGPAYTFRNVIVNVVNEGMKLHSEGSSAGPKLPSGVLVFNNTFVRSDHAIQLSTPDAVRFYRLANNLFVTASPSGGLTVNWDTPIDFASGSIDYDGYFPEGKFHFGYGSATGKDYASFADVVAGGRYEGHGTLLTMPIFGSGLVAPTDFKPRLAPADATLAATSNAIDKGIAISNVTDGFKGAAPDLGALELGCPAPIFGVRPEGMDESTEPKGCTSSGPIGGDAGPDATKPDGASTDGAFDSFGPIDDACCTGPFETGDDAGSPTADSGGSSSSGCGCRVAGSPEGRFAPLGIAIVALVLALRARRDRSLRS